MKWKVMDAMNMDYEDESFDVVIDKSKATALTLPYFRHA